MASSRCEWPPHSQAPHHQAGRPGWVSYHMYCWRIGLYIQIIIVKIVECRQSSFRNVKIWSTQYIQKIGGKGQGSWVSDFYLPWEELCIWIVLKAEKLSIARPVHFSYIMLDQGIFLKLNLIHQMNSLSVKGVHIMRQSSLSACAFNFSTNCSNSVMFLMWGLVPCRTCTTSGWLKVIQNVLFHVLEYSTV